MRSLFVASTLVFLSSASVMPAFADNAAPTMPPAQIASTQGDISAPPMAKLPNSAPQEAPKLQPDQYLTQAQDAYKNGELKQSLDLIAKAQTGIRTKRAELYKPLLPPTPENWKENDGNDSQLTMDASMLGGMSAITRTYTGYGHTISVAYIVDSPMMNFLSTMMKMVSALKGPTNSTETVQGNQAMYKEVENKAKGTTSHQLMVFAGDVMVVLQSDTLPKETIMQFADIVPYEKLKTVK